MTEIRRLGYPPPHPIGTRRQAGMLAERTGVHFAHALAADLADQRESFQDFDVAHESTHLRIPNHGALFKAVMTVHVPNWREFELQR